MHLAEEETSSASATVRSELQIPQVTWYKNANLRKLYAMMPILFMGATTNGYDGSLLNGLQTMGPWQDRELLRRALYKQSIDHLHVGFNNPSGATLGLFSAILQIGAFSALFFCEKLTHGIVRLNSG